MTIASDGTIPMHDSHTFTVVYSQDGLLWIGFVEDWPGAMSQGETLAECQANLRGALDLMLAMHRKELARELEGHTVRCEPLVLA